MVIEKFSGGFKERFESKTIREIVCTYDGIYSVRFYDGRVKEVHGECSSYNSQFGVPASPDGRTLFVCSWETGLTAYDIDTDSTLWHFKSTRIKSVFAYQTYIVAMRYGEAVIKFDINDGRKIGELRSRTLERLYDLSAPFVLANTFRGKLSVIDTETMTVAKQYSPKTVNPANALSLLINEVSLKRNKLTICGFENQWPFKRVIDTHFWG